MNMTFALMARFQSPTVELKQISQEFFGYTPKTAEAKAKAQELPVPTFKLRQSERAPTLVYVADLGAYLEQCYSSAKVDWDTIQQAKH